MPKNPTTADAQLILQLYDLRREAEMRKARKWYAGSFWPENGDDYAKVANAFSIPENAWLRQVISYWGMAAALVLKGALNEELFFETCGEMWFTLSKVSPIMKDVRAKMQTPELFAHMEKLATRSKAGKERLKNLEARMAAWRKSMLATTRDS
jgi:hypothetical protein